jgi:hypothetical protein
VVSVLAAAVAERGAPAYIRSDNGPEFIAKAVREWIADQGFQTLNIEPGSPWQNAYSESFNSRLRDELLNREVFATLAEAKVLGREYRRAYNKQRLHSSRSKAPLLHCSPSIIVPLFTTHKRRFVAKAQRSTSRTLSCLLGSGSYLATLGFAFKERKLAGLPRLLRTMPRRV